MNKLGDTAYDKGLNVTLTIHSKYQEKANAALRKGLLDYDVRHGYRGPVDTLDIEGLEEFEINELLIPFQPSQELIPAVVVSASTEAFGAHTRDGESIEVTLDAMKWAKPYKTPNSIGGTPTSAADIVKQGDVVYLTNEEDKGWKLSQLPAVSGALVSLDSSTGAVLALTGGFDYYLSKFNRAVQAQRQPGSNIKPFIYSSALDNGFTPGSLVSGAPIVVEDNLEGIWRPENYSKKFFGPTRLRQALSLSLNLVSVRLLRAVGIKPTIDHLSKFGFDPERLPRSLSLSLGSTAITPLDLASGYTVFANGGEKTDTHFIAKIEDAEGNAVDLDRLRCGDNCQDDIENIIQTADAAEPKSDIEVNPRAISEQNAFLTTSIMKQVILSGTGKRALALNRRDLAGKTGTTNNYRDAWFSGFNPDVTTTVFVGFDEPAHLGRRESGASAALPIWVDYMGTVLEDFPEQNPEIPQNIITRFINKESGLLTSSDDPNGYMEYFLTGTEPSNPVLTPTQVAGQSTSAQQPTSESVSESLF